MIEGAKKNCKDLNTGPNRVGEYIHSRIQDYEFGHKVYDCIWIQSTLCYLDDGEL